MLEVLIEIAEGPWTEGETGLAVTNPVMLKRLATIMKNPKNLIVAMRDKLTSAIVWEIF